MSDERRIVITVTPSEGHEGKMRLDDAFQQVLDFLQVAEDAKAHLGWSSFDFEWRLEKASANSPLSVTAIAAPVVAGALAASIIGHVDEVEKLAAGAFNNVARGMPAPSWLTPDGTASLAQIHRRATNGISATTFDFGQVTSPVSITTEVAVAALPSLERVSIAAPEQFPLRVVHGEIDGRLVSVGRWRGHPAFQITSAQYGLIWCVVPELLMERFGGEQTLSDVWKGKRVSVPGRIFYGQNGKPTRIEAVDIRPREVPDINIDDLLDDQFTAGLDPVDYLDKLHGGGLG